MLMKVRIQNFLLNPITLIVTYTCIAAIIAILKYSLGAPNSHINNFIIYKTSFDHLSLGLNLYNLYPAEYFDRFLYGPLFSFLIAPFSVVPTIVGVTFWNILNGVLFIFAIYQLPLLTQKQKAIIGWLTLNSCITAFSNVQFHGIVTALIILSYSRIQSGKDLSGTFFIVLGTLLKVYGIVGLAFFMFSKNKPRFILWGIIWSAVLILLPACFTTFEYLLQCYNDWFETLFYKNSSNKVITNLHTDMSAMGMVRRILNDDSISGLYFILPAVLIFGLSFLRFQHFKKIKFQLLILSSVLLMIVLSNTNSEASTLLIGFTGVTIWYVTCAKRPLDHFLFFLALIFTSFGPSDLMPRFLRNEYLRKYALMALPLLLVWIKINYELIFNKMEVNEPKSGN